MDNHQTTTCTTLPEDNTCVASPLFKKTYGTLSHPPRRRKQGPGIIMDETTALLSERLRSNSFDSFSVRSGTDISIQRNFPLPPKNISGSTTTTSNNKTLEHARRILYVSHFFNQFSEQVWQFCLQLFLAAYTNNASLLLVMTYSLITNLCIVLFGASLGRYIDGSNRLSLARQFIGLENFCVVTATFLCFLLLSRDADRMKLDGDEDNIPVDDDEALYNLKSVSLLVGIHLLGAIAMILDTGFLVAVERDWVVVMSIGACNLQKSVRSSLNSSSKSSTTNELLMTKEEEDEIKQAWLTDTNVSMRQIDLICKMIAPAIGGYFLAIFDPEEGTSLNHGYELRGATLAIGGINVLALLVEYVCTEKIYNTIPELQLMGDDNDNDSSIDKDGDDSKKSDDDDPDETTNEKTKKKEAETSSSSVVNDLKTYFDQIVGWAGFALALLYLNVALSFGNLMTVYLVWRQISMGTIGFWRGVSAAAGLGGTYVYHYMSSTRKIELVDIGMISVLFEVACLSTCFVAIFIDDNRIFMILLVGGVCFSRIGLWVFDISVTMLMQLHVPPPIRGLTGGVQQSLNAFFTVISYVVGLFLSDPTQFPSLASISFAGVVLAGVFYGLMVFSRRSLFVSSTLDTINKSMDV